MWELRKDTKYLQSGPKLRGVFSYMRYVPVNKCKFRFGIFFNTNDVFGTFYVVVS